MPAQALYDFAPALQLMALGLVLALGPIAWVWLRNPQASLAGRRRALTLLTLFLTFDLVIFGAFTRLSDSGLGCPDWPGCYGSASPSGAAVQIAQAQAALPDGPVTHRKAWIEMLHRYLASAVGVLILTLAVATWAQHWRVRASPHVMNPWWPTVTLVWVCVQGAFGALTVTMKLFPAIVTLHLLGGLGLLVLLTLQAVKYGRFHSGRARASVRASTRTLVIVAFLLLAIQVALGGWVSTNYAVLACRDFPTCQGQWWPVMNFAQGFELWRELGKTGSGHSVDFAALTAIHFTHRLFAVLLVVALVLLAWQLRAVESLRAHGRWLVALLLWQVLSGVSNVVLDWPMLAALAHTAGAAALAIVMSVLLFDTRAVRQLGGIVSAAASGYSR